MHQGGNGAASFQSSAYCFSVFLTTGLAAENATQSTIGNITALTDHTITVNGVTWNTGDTLKVYKTATKGAIISQQWVDLSRGWKTTMKELQDGWKPEDIDLNRNGDQVFGPGQPEPYRK